MDFKCGIDEVDLKIIELLKENGRKPYRKIGVIIGMSEVTVRRRIKKMFEESYIKNFTINLGNKCRIIYDQWKKEKN
ncbi:MAG: AsnC family transcriptional regulator [Promethearchaeota archaeon]